MVKLSDRRIVELSSRPMLEWWELSNRRFVEWWNGGVRVVVESSNIFKCWNGGMVKLSTRREVECVELSNRRVCKPDVLPTLSVSSFDQVARPSRLTRLYKGN